MVTSPPALDDSTSLVRALHRDGFVVTSPLFDEPELASARSACDRVIAERTDRESRPGVRRLLAVLPEIRAIADAPGLRVFVTAALGPGAFVTRSILFDKTPTANWGVPWHQDTTIAVSRHLETFGFGPWSVKEGVPHVRPPAAILDRTLTIRLHLDACGPENGPLIVLPGTHNRGILAEQEIERLVRGAEPVECVCRAGAAVVMHPLLIHASRKSSGPAHRRVIHLEFATDPLPGGLEWGEA